MRSPLDPMIFNLCFQLKALWPVLFMNLLSFAGMEWSRSQSTGSWLRRIAFSLKKVTASYLSRSVRVQGGSLGAFNVSSQHSMIAWHSSVKVSEGNVSKMSHRICRHIGIKGGKTLFINDTIWVWLVEKNAAITCLTSVIYQLCPYASEPVVQPEDTEDNMAASQSIFFLFCNHRVLP